MREVIRDCGCVSTEYEGRIVFVRYCPLALAAIAKDEKRKAWAPSDGKRKVYRKQKVAEEAKG